MTNRFAGVESFQRSSAVDIDALAAGNFRQRCLGDRINGFKGFIFRRSSIFTVNK
ncbi:Uncharacterised protein [Shigella sonnei]|nr:Uncharacterised protein [Shigella sonnei]